MANNVAHFIVHANDLVRARRFYENVFGWKFEPWGPPDFFLITTGDAKDPGIGGALEKRQGPLPADGVRGYECTISVQALDAIAAAIVKYGGEGVTAQPQGPPAGLR